jgi:hypothetical protein
MRATLLALCLFTATTLFASTPETNTPLGTATELQLPPFQSSSLSRDLPIRALHFADDHTLMVLGASALWQWRIEERSLHRLILGGKTPLTHLGTDGISWFAASPTELFQVRWDQGRVFRFPLPAGGAPLGFGGSGDDFWLVHSQGLLKFDRYGHTLSPRLGTPSLSPEDHAVLRPERKALWYVHGAKLFRIDLGGDGEPVPVLAAKHPLLGLAAAGRGFLAYTAHAVLRLTPEGKLKRSIPVEGRRQLAQVFVGDDLHAYLFSDQLLEVYRLKERQVERYRLPLDEGETPGEMAVQGHVLALTVDGHPRLFHLRFSLPPGPVGS